MADRPVGVRQEPAAHLCQQRAEQGRSQFDWVRQVEGADISAVFLVPGRDRRPVLQKHHLHAQLVPRTTVGVLPADDDPRVRRVRGGHPRVLHVDLDRSATRVAMRIDARGQPRTMARSSVIDGARGVHALPGGQPGLTADAAQRPARAVPTGERSVDFGSTPDLPRGPVSDRFHPHGKTGWIDNTYCNSNS